MRSGSTTCTFRCSSASAASCPTCVFECAGNPAAPQLAIELVRSRGIIVLLGVLEEPVEISQLVLMIKEAQLRASFAYRREDFEEAVALLAERRLPADRLITGTAPLEQAQEMFDRLEDPAHRRDQDPPAALSV